MERKLAIYDGAVAADEADRAYYAALTPEERLDVALELIRRYRESLDETAQRFERVHRVVELSKS